MLLGDRYGWEPLPEEIPTNEFDEIKKAVDSDKEATGLNALALLEKWYRLDLNAVPSVYVLQPRTGPFEDYATWEREAERPLRYVFREAVKGLRLGDEAFLKYVSSATHQEIERGGMQVEDAGNHVFGFFRRITNLDELAANLPDTAAKDFVDSDIQGRFDKTAHEKLRTLKDELRTKIGQANTYEYHAQWTGQGVSTNHIGTLPETLEACEAILNEDYFPRNMCEAVWRELAHLIKAEVEKIEAKDPLDQENEAHAEFRKDRAKVFIGRKDILNEIDLYIGDNRRQPLAIHGASGSGKSALMARAVQNLRDRKKDSSTQEAVIIERFIGATPESTDIRLLLEGLCKVINRVYSQDEFEVPEDFNKLVQAFEDRMTLATSEKPLLVFLDALDQLSQAESAHNLNWLPSELPPNVKIIVSTLPEPYPCLNTLMVKLPPENIKELQFLSPQHGEEALEVWLTTAGRTLQEEQRREVLGNFSQCRLPLYLKLAFEEAKRWHSYDDVPEYEGRPGLAKDISGIIGNLFWRLSLPVNHGNLLVERSLGYMTAAKNGLTEDEMLDVLSRDKEFYTQFRGQTFHELTEERLPIIVWSRLYFDLAPYLTERTADGTSLLSFYHRQLGEVAMETFLSGEREQQRHCNLAQYFVGQKHWIKSGDKKISNLRKLSELPYQQTQGEMWNDIEAILTDLIFIEAKCAAGMTYDLIDDYNVALDSLPENQEERRKEKDHEEWTKKYTEDMIAYAKAWNDARECYAENPRKYPMPKPEEIPLPEIIPSVEPWTDNQIHKDTEKIKNNPTRLDRIRAFSQFVNSETNALVNFGYHPGFCVQHAYNSANSGPVARAAESIIHTGLDNILLLHSSLQRVDYTAHPALLNLFEEPSFGVKHTGSVFITADGKRVVSSYFDYNQNYIHRVLDLRNGNTLKEIIEPKGTGSINHVVSITPDGKFAITSCSGRYLYFWDLEKGICLRTLEGHTGRIGAVSITPDGKRAVSGGFEDETIRVWDLEGGHLHRAIRSFSGPIVCVSITPNGRIAVSTNSNDCFSAKQAHIANNTLQVWDLESGQCIRKLKGHKLGIESLCVTPDGKRVVSGGMDKTLRLWNLKSGQCIKTIEGFTGPVECISITPDGNKAISSGTYKTIRVWDLKNGSCLRVLEGHTNYVNSVSITPDGRRAVSASRGPGFRIWDIEAGECLRTLERHKDLVTIDPRK